MSTERAFYNTLREYAPHPGLGRVEAVTDALGIPLKRREYWLQKWSDKGWWNYGVSPRSGWFEPGAPDRLPE